MATIVQEITTNAVEILSTVSVEVAMVGLAAIVWFTATGTVLFPKGSKKCLAQGLEDHVRNSSGKWSPRLATIREAKEKVSQSKGKSVPVKSFPKPVPSSDAARVTTRVKEEFLARDIRACGKSGNLQGAIELFDNAGGHAKSSFSLNAMLEACIECGNIKMAADYFSKAESVADVVSYNIMMKGYLAQGDETTATALLRQISEKGLSATHSSYHGLVNARVCAQDRAGAWKLVDEMQVAGVVPNMVTCSILVKSKTNSANEVSKVLALVDTLDLQMDEIFFATVVESCARTNSLDLLSKQTAKFARQGGSVALAAPTYGSMIRAYGQMWDVKRVWELWT